MRMRRLHTVEHLTDSVVGQLLDLAVLALLVRDSVRVGNVHGAALPCACTWITAVLRTKPKKNYFCP